jgi:hypothetical protein
MFIRVENTKLVKMVHTYYHHHKTPQIPPPQNRGATFYVLVIPVIILCAAQIDKRSLREILILEAVCFKKITDASILEIETQGYCIGNHQFHGCQIDSFQLCSTDRSTSLTFICEDCRYD